MEEQVAAKECLKNWETDSSGTMFCEAKLGTRSARWIIGIMIICETNFHDDVSRSETRHDICEADFVGS